MPSTFTKVPGRESAPGLWLSGEGEAYLPGAAAAGAKALDLPRLGGRHVVRSPAHLAHEPLLLHLAPELAQRLLELLGILYNYPQDRQSIPDGAAR